MAVSGKTILVTGGAGFIGRAVVKELLARGAEVRVLDSLVPQVHGHDPSLEGLRDCDFHHGDLRDRDAVVDALCGIDGVIHLAAEVGVGQSMYDIRRYTEANDLATAVLLEAMIGGSASRIVTASSMSIYGEGLYVDDDGRTHEEVRRSSSAVRERRWDPTDEEGRLLEPLPTPENKRPNLASVYAIGKYVQERMTLTVGEAYGVDAVALRLWNVFGPGQALSNPYTGVLAIFAARLANGKPPMIFEDGQQLRDFVHVDDVARAFVAALESDGCNGDVINIASGKPRSVTDVAYDLAEAMGSPIEPEITHSGRVGDIRHCIADIAHARDVLGYAPREDFRTRLEDLAEWVGSQGAVDRVDQARGELVERGLVV